MSEHHPNARMPGVGRTFVGGFESTHLPGAGVDLLELTGHTAGWRQDLDRMLAAGVRHLRYPLCWHRIEPEPGRYDWAETDTVLGYLRDAGALPIVDLVHHASYPDWLADGFRDRGFGPAYVRYAEAVAARYPWLPACTLFNEPFATLFLAGPAQHRVRRLHPVRAAAGGDGRVRRRSDAVRAERGDPVDQPDEDVEYLAAGLPVVSTRVPDVVADYPGVVHFAAGGAGFALACREVVRDGLAERDRRLAPIRDRQEWESIAASMAALLDRVRSRPGDSADEEKEAAG